MRRISDRFGKKKTWPWRMAWVAFAFGMCDLIFTLNERLSLHHSLSPDQVVDLVGQIVCKDPPLSEFQDGYECDTYAQMLYRLCKRAIEYFEDDDCEILHWIKPRISVLCFDASINLDAWVYRRWLWILKTANLLEDEVFFEALLQRISSLLDPDLLPIVLYSPEPVDWLGLIPLSPIPSLRILWQPVICLTWLERHDDRFMLPAEQLADLFVTDQDSYALFNK